MSHTRLHRARPPLARREPNRPVLALTPGVRLRASVLLAMTGLDAHDDPMSVGNELRGALAYTAAIGETCMVTEAAEAVRLAVRCLACGEADEARAALTEAEKHLPVMVSTTAGAATLVT